MALVVWLALRMNRKPSLESGRVGLILAFNGILPVGLVLLGLGLMAPAFWTLTWVRTAAFAALGIAGLILLALIIPVGKRRF
jgi:hypothetical protein